MPSDQRQTEFDGATFDPDKDGPRLSRQMRLVVEWMVRGDWWTIPELAEKVGAAQTSISARFRDLRKKEFGEHTVDVRRVPGRPGLNEYKLTINPLLAGSGRDQLAPVPHDSVQMLFPGMEQPRQGAFR